MLTSQDADHPDVLSLESGLEALQSSQEFRGPVEELDGHDSNDHLALIYENQTEQFAAAVPFMRQGLQRNERCLYIIDENSEDEVLTALRDGGVDVDAALESGALTIHSKQDTYLRDGAFDPDDMIEFLSDAIDEATEEYEALRIAGEMTWIFGDEPEIGELIEYEGKLNRLMPEEDCIALCQYNRERFPPEVIRDILRTHPHLIYDGMLCQNFYYTPPEEFFGPERPDREIDRMMQTLMDRTEARTELQNRERSFRKLYETTADPDLTFGEKLTELLELGRERFGLDVGFFSHTDDETFEVVDVVGSHEELQAGSVASLEDTYCHRLLESSGPLGVTDAPSQGWEGDPAYEKYGLNAYLGTTVSSGTETYGTLCFASRDSRSETFSEDEFTFLELIGQWLSHELGREEREQYLREQNEITANPDQSFEEKLQDLFELGCERFGLELGAMARVDPEADRFEIEYTSDDHEQFEPGFEIPLSETYCTAATENSGAVGVSSPGTEYEDITVYRDFGLQAYLGTHVTVDGGPDRTFFFVSSEPRSGEFSCDELNFHRLMGQWVKHELEWTERGRDQRELYEITANGELGFDEKVDRLLKLGCERFEADIGMLTRERDKAFEIERMHGDHSDLDEGVLTPPMTDNYCRRVVDEGESLCVADAGEAGWDEDALYEEFDLHCYAGTEVAAGNECYGTICFTNLSPRATEFSDDERTFLELMGQWVSYELERKQREDRLSSLNDLTQELMNAETATEVSECIVGSAEAHLDLPVTSVALYDSAEGSLAPTSTTDPATDLIDATDAFEVGEGVGWQAFAANELKREAYPAGEAADLLHPAVTELVAVPLGNHGVFLTGAIGTDGFSPTEFDFVETVAGNVNAALDRATREKQLYEREETLEEQNESLERLERINTTIRRIDQALVSASGRDEIADVVCRELADAGPYELAWFGKHDPVTGEIEPKASAGAENGYLDDIRENDDSVPEGESPSARAARTREPQVVNEILDDPPFAPWRRAALSRGYHAVISLPLIHEETLFGVLSLYADESGVFDDLERTVLGELSDTIAYAINAVESKKALVSNEVTELKFSLSETDSGVVQLVDETGCKFTYENTVPQANGRLRGFFTTRGVSPDVVRGYAPNMPVDELELLSERTDDGEQVCLFETELTEESLAETVLEHGGTIDEYRAGSDGSTVSVHVAADAAVREFVSTFKTKNPDAEVVAKRTCERPEQTLTEFHAVLTEELTARQLETLQTAYFSGYFENPRTRNGSEIAASMDISQPTFNNHLRAAQRKLYRRLFEEDSV